MSEFERDYQRSLDLFSDAAKLQPDDAGVLAIAGAALVTFSDRLPDRLRPDAANLAYQAYTHLWRVQAADFDKLPAYSKGELLAGLAQAAQRLGGVLGPPCGPHLSRRFNDGFPSGGTQLAMRLYRIRRGYG